MKKSELGKLDQLIYFYQDMENASTKDTLGGYDDTWIPALGEISDVAESGTTTTNIKMTAHGMATGDYIINSTRSGAVRQIVRFDANNVTVTAITGQTTNDVILKRITTSSAVWARIKSSNSYDSIESQQKTPNITHTVEIRYRTDITAKMRIVWGSRTLEIISFSPSDTRKDRLFVDCRELI